MSSSTKKVDEAQEHIRQAEKSLKTSLLKWRPDYDLAADEYNKAATCYKTIKNYVQCKECLQKAAFYYKQHKSFFSAGKCYDQAVLVSKELGNMLDVADYAEKACSLFQEHGSPDTGALCLDRAAKIIEQTHPDRALVLYLRAADVAMIEDKTRQAAEFMSKAARTMVKLRRFDEAADAIRREIGLHQKEENLPCMGRLVVCLVLVQLAREDYVAAEKAFREWGNCCDAEEVQVLETLLDAYDQEDGERAKRALNSPFIKHMDVEYSKLARDLPLPSGILSGSQLPQDNSNIVQRVNEMNISKGEADTPAQQKGGDDDDDFEGGLL